MIYINVKIIPNKLHCQHYSLYYFNTLIVYEKFNFGF